MSNLSNAAGVNAPAPTQTSANPNGHVPIVFTYGGTGLTYLDFLAQFYVTLPGGNGVQLGANQCLGYQGNGTGSTPVLGTSYALNTATSAIGDLLPTNSAGQLQAAFTQWAATQASSTGQSAYANLYLSHYTGGRVYLSNGDLGLGASGEPTPSSTSDPAYGLVYDIFEPYIGAQVGSSTIAGNLADITDVDWFSFPISLKVWGYDFAGDPGTLTLLASAAGGDGNAIWNALQIAGGATPTNQYPSAALPTPGGSSAPCRLVSPTMAATSGYYCYRQQDLFPYSYFDDYLLYLQQNQGKSASLFTLSGSYAGNNTGAQTPNNLAQNFSFSVDFSGIATATYSYPGGSATQITPASQVVLSGYTSLLGSESAPFSITLPWALGNAQYGLPSNPNLSAQADAIAQGWLSLPGSTTPTAPSGTYAALPIAVQDASGTTLPAAIGEALVTLIYSVNSNPLAGAGSLDDLYQGGNGTWLTVTGTTGLSCAASATYTQDNGVLIISTDANGNLQTISINDIGTGPGVAQGTQWTVLANATGLSNNQPFTITLAQMPQLRNAFIGASATYTPLPASLTATPTAGYTCTLDITAADLMWSFAPSIGNVTLSQPAGIYGANAGYTIAGLGASNSNLNGSQASLQNDVFGWIVADLLAAINAGLVAAPVTYPGTGQSIGQSSSQWYTMGENPYESGYWGATAWAGTTWNGAAITDFWDSWAWELFNVPGGTNAYNFAFTDRFEENILVGFDPPPASPQGTYAVLLEVVVGDSPVIALPA